MFSSLLMVADDYEVYYVHYLWEHYKPLKNDQFRKLVFHKVKHLRSMLNKHNYWLWNAVPGTALWRLYRKMLYIHMYAVTDLIYFSIILHTYLKRYTSFVKLCEKTWSICFNHEVSVLYLIDTISTACTFNCYNRSEFVTIVQILPINISPTLKWRPYYVDRIVYISITTSRKEWKSNSFFFEIYVTFRKLPLVYVHL